MHEQAPPDPLATANGSGEHAPTEAERLAGLVQQCARGDEDSFAALYDAIAARVHGLALRVIRSPELAAEVTQEVFLEAWRTASRFDPSRGSVLAWLTTMAHRRAVDRVRASERQRVRDQNWTREEAPYRGPEHAVDQTWTEASRSLEAQRVRRGMESLTAVQRESVNLAYFGGYSHHEVATLLDLPLGTVKTRIRDGLIRLRDVMGVDDE